MKLTKLQEALDRFNSQPANRKVTLDRLKDWGYVQWKQKVAIKTSKKDESFFIYELVDEDNKLKALSFCALCSPKTNLCCILPREFSYYKD